MKEAIEAIIKEISPNIIVRPNSNLIDDLGFDSVNMLQLITDLEAHFNFELKDEDLNIENFITPSSIGLLLKRYLPAS